MKFAWLLVLVLSTSVLGAPRKIQFALKNHCVQWLQIRSDLDSAVDWGQFRKNLLQLGYPQSVIEHKIQESKSHFDQDGLRTHIRSLLEDPTWDWGDKLTAASYKKIVSPWNTTELLMDLGYMDVLPGFDVSAFVSAYLDRARADQSMGKQEAKYLMYWSHLWLRGERKMRLAQKFLRLLPDPDVMGWMLTQLSSAERKEIKPWMMDLTLRSYQKFANGQLDYHELLLRFLHYLPSDFLPQELKTELRKWVDLEKYPPVRLNSVRVCPLGFKYAGNCEFMTLGHVRTLGLHGGRAEEWRENVLLQVQGHVIGSFKLTGDPSMIALRNVTDDKGRLVLVMGGVYQLTQDLATQLESMTLTEGKWRGASLRDLKVTPSTFLLNENAWSTSNFESLVRIAGLKSIDDTEDTPELRDQTWPQLLSLLNQIREKFENSDE